ncbi:MAG: methylated-DNA--[Oscillospiraceae bacterium]|nr:methylated-DNA--[protein]-cysteine S-methyltransferase [Oscillospiraceae bacterium]MBQ7130384.1 methylated-DNA--[protein]-cysteine S-methyltransferase [Oscillospiraceae bacterium]
MQIDKYDSPMGTLWLSGEAGVLTALSFFQPDVPEAECYDFTQVKHWLDNYFRGQHCMPDFLMAPRGTAFQRLVWNLLLEIPFGEIRTYGEVASMAARQMGKEKMFAQAVGQAVSRNPIAIIIPCHRVIGAGGSLTGYASGIHRKQWLLDHERT